MVAIGYYCHTWVYTTMVRPNLNHPDDGGPVCLADRLWCKRLVIGCYSKQHNCLVKDEWRQIGLRTFRLCRVCFHGVHPWNEHVCSSTSERSHGGRRHLPAQKGPDVKKKPCPAVVRWHRGVWQIRTSTFIVSARLCVAVCLYILHSFLLCLLSLSHRGPGVFGQFVPVALDFQADLANFWGVQYRKQFFFFSP